LTAAEAKFRALVEQSIVGIYVIQDDGFVYVNPKMSDIFGTSVEDLTSRPVSDFIAPEDRDLARENIEKRLLEIPSAIRHELRMLHKTGVVLHVEVHGTRTEFAGRPAVLGTLLDISERKQAEQQVRAALQEKEVLLREIHHRVKNNMQLISSLLNLQASSLNDPAILAQFRDAQDRVRAMARLHERLYGSMGLSQLNFADYARDLLQDIWRAYSATAEHVTLRLEIEPVPLTLDEAIPCGLIINELATNAFKYAFPARANGAIEVQMRAGPDRLIELVFRDNGVGLPVELDIANAPTLGLRLVDMLVAQLKGRVDIKRGDGTEFRICFKGA
jgi:PAS domain S-box-containing protein